LSELVFCKLGGSIITDKRHTSTARPDVIERLAREIAQAVKDRPALRLLLGHGSGSFGHVVAKKYHVHQGIADKGAELERLMTEVGCAAAETACVGDDTPDAPMLSRAGLAIAVADAHPALIAVAHWVTKAKGGRGAVREVCDLLLSARAA